MSAPRSHGHKSPIALLEAFVGHVNARELDALVALYEPDAVFVPSPGVVHRGHPAIRGALGDLLALKPTMTTTIEEVLEEGGTALAIVAWNLRGTAPDGTEVIQTGKSADVLRRRVDGTWAVSIDHP